jgi:hypothetical protein
MSNSRHLAAPLRSRRRLSTDRIISTGLAVTACAGMVAVIGVRSMEDSAATQQAATVDAGAVSSTGLTEAQLDDYAAQLQAESARLDSYRDKLATVAASLKTTPAARQSPVTKSRPVAKPKPVAKPAPVAKPKPVAKPAPVAKPKPAAKPQSHTKSS